MIGIYHVSDLHFHHDDRKNQEALALLQRIAREVPFGASDPNYLLITGDLTDDGDPRQHARLQEALLPFRDHLLVCPGNHDYGPLGNLYELTCAERFDSVLLSSLGVTHRFLDKEPAITRLADKQDTRVVLYGLNSILKTTRVDDFARGAIGESQLQALHRALECPEDRTAVKVVYLHHRPQRCNWFLELVDSEDLMAVVHNRVDVLAFGHEGHADEPPQARMMHVMPRKPYGVGYLLNANSSVRTQRYYQILIQGKDVSIQLR